MALSFVHRTEMRMFGMVDILERHDRSLRPFSAESTFEDSFKVLCLNEEVIRR